MSVFTYNDPFHWDGAGSGTPFRRDRTILDRSFTGGTATPTSWNPSTAGTDEQGRTVLAGTVTGRGWDLNSTTEIQQGHNATLDFTDCKFIIYGARTNLASGESNMAEGNTGALATWQLNNCTFITSKGNGDSANSVFGHNNTGATAAGYFRNCTWQGARNQDDTGYAPWFIELWEVAHDFELLNPTFILATLSTPRRGGWINGANFDGTIHNEANEYFTMRIRDDQTVTFSSVLQSDFANFHDSATFGYTAGNDVANTGLSLTAGRHIRVLGDISPTSFPNDPHRFWLINNRYEADTIAASIEAGRLREGYAWRPRFLDAGTRTQIPDIMLHGLIGTTGDSTGTNGVEAAMFVMPDTVNPLSPPTRIESDQTTGSFQDRMPNGLLIQRSALIGGGNDDTHQLAKALEWSETEYTPVSDAVHSIGVKSYSHLVDIDVTSTVNLIDYTGGNSGTVTWQSEDIYEAIVDPNLNDLAVDDSRFTGNLNFPNIDDWYALVKNRWYNAGTNERLPITRFGPAVVFTHNTSVNNIPQDQGSPYTLNAAGTAVERVSIQSGGTISGDDVSMLGASGAGVTVSLNSVTVGSGLMLLTQGGATMDLVGTTFQGDINIGGTFDRVTGSAIGSINNVDKPLFIHGPTTINLVNTGGTVTLRPVTLLALGGQSGTLTLNANSPTMVGVPYGTNGQPDNRFTAGTNVTFFQATDAPVNFVVSSGDLNGHFAIKNETTGQWANASGEFEAFNANTSIITVPPGEAQTIRINSRNVVGDTIRAYYKAFNDYSTAVHVGYATTIVPLNTTAVLTTETPVLALQTPISPTIFSSDVFTGANVDTDLDAGQLRFTVSGTTPDQRSGASTQNLLMRETDSFQYFEFMTQQDRTEDLLVAGEQATIIDALGAHLLHWRAALDGSGNSVQQEQLQAVDNVNTTLGDNVTRLTINNGSPIDTPSVIFFTNPAGVTVDDIVQALNNSTIATDIATTAAATTTIGSDVTTIGQNVVATGLHVNTVRRATGYVVGNGTATGTAGSRLNGIKPKSADYDPDTTYEDIL